jgi:tryptophan-rich sensory protein
MKSFFHLLCLLSLITHGLAKTPFRRAEFSAVKSNKNVVIGSAIHPWNAPTKSSFDTALQLCGGACNDSNPALFFKVALSSALETATMLGLIVGANKLSEKVQVLPDLFGLPLLQWLSLVAVIFASSFFGSIVDGGLSAATNQLLDPNQIPGDPDWYATLIKPSWNPPGWVFPIMWLLVSKPTQLVAISLILKKAKSVASEADMVTKLPIEILAIYCAHLSLGDAWNKVFFGLQCTGRGAAVITAFFGLLLTSAYLFYTIDPAAGKFMLPTCGWVLIAFSLNWNIHLNNKNK